MFCCPWHFPQGKYLSSIRRAFKRSTQGLAPEHIILYYFNVKGKEQKVYFTITIKLFKTLRELCPFFGQGSDEGGAINWTLFGTTNVLFLWPTHQRCYFFSLLSQNGHQDCHSSALSNSPPTSWGQSENTQKETYPPRRNRQWFMQYIWDDGSKLSRKNEYGWRLCSLEIVQRKLSECKHYSVDLFRKKKTQFERFVVCFVFLWWLPL